MLAIFHKAFAHPPEELNSPASFKGSKKPKLPEETLKDFLSHHPHNTCSTSFGQAAVLAYVRPDNPFSVNQRLLCSSADITYWLLTFVNLKKKNFSCCWIKINTFVLLPTIQVVLVVTQFWSKVTFNFAGSSVGLMTYTASSWGAWTTCLYSSSNMVCQRVLMRPCLWLKLIRLFVTVVHTQQIKLWRTLMEALPLLSMTARLAVSLLHWYICWLN